MQLWHLEIPPMKKGETRFNDANDDVPHMICFF